eukprot:scaffold161763_cov18-Tisochrysis_lutea.AAC.1
MQVALRNQVRVAASGRPDANLDESLQLVKNMLEEASNQHMGDSMHAIYGAAAALESDRLQELAALKASKTECQAPTELATSRIMHKFDLYNPTDRTSDEQLYSMGVEPSSLDVELAAAKLSMAAGHLASVERELSALRIS